MTEETLKAVEQIGDALTDLFVAEATALLGSTDPRMQGRAEAYALCAEAVTKATTRRLIVAPSLTDCEIQFRVPSEAKP